MSYIESDRQMDLDTETETDRQTPTDLKDKKHPIDNKRFSGPYGTHSPHLNLPRTTGSQITTP